MSLNSFNTSEMTIQNVRLALEEKLIVMLF